MPLKSSTGMDCLKNCLRAFSKCCGEAKKINVHLPKTHVQNIIVGSNLMAAQAALLQAQEESFHPYLLRTDLQGEARDVATDLSIQLRWAWKMSDPVPRPGCIVAGGETTVTVHGDGRGGRNTELALAAVSELADFPDVMLVTLATDGEDGSTDAAGAVVTGDTWRSGIELGMNSSEFLNRNDSYTYFNAWMICSSLGRPARMSTT